MIGAEAGGGDGDSGTVNRGGEEQPSPETIVKAFAALKPSSQDVWLPDKEVSEQSPTCCPYKMFMRLPCIISLLAGVALLSVALALARESLTRRTSKKLNCSDLSIRDEYAYRYFLSDEWMMKPSARRPEKTEYEGEAQEWRGDGGIGGSSFHRGDRDNPDLSRERQPRHRSAHLANVGGSYRLGRSSKDLDSLPSHVGSDPATAEDQVAPTRHKQIGAINIDKIKGIEASPSDIKELGIEQDQVTSESALDLRRARCANNIYDDRIAARIDGRNLSRPIRKEDGRFDNPFSTWSQQSMIDIFKFTVLESDESNVPKDKEDLYVELPLVKPNFATGSEDFRVTWIGHSTMVIQVDGLNILTDPIFSERASPTQFIGPKRIIEPACQIKELPRIDIVLISHNHYDHLDADSVKMLNDRFGRKCRWIVPQKLGPFMQSIGVRNYVELDWWQKDCTKLDGNNEDINMSSSRTKPSDSESSVDVSSDERRIRLGQRELETEDVTPSSDELTIYLTPAQHWSRRGITDVNRSLWGSFTIVDRKGSTFLFAGDTAYCSAFKEIGEVFGPFTGAAIPIGAYSPRWFLKTSHVDPDEAVAIHRDIRSMKSISIHHSTFILSSEPYREPAMRLKKLNENLEEPFISLKHGETTLFFNNSTRRYSSKTI